MEAIEEPRPRSGLSRVIDCLPFYSHSEPPPYGNFIEINSWGDSGSSKSDSLPPLPAKRKCPRLVGKDGMPLLKAKQLPNLVISFQKNWFHLVIERSWRSVLLFCTLAFVFSWICFAILYWCIVLIEKGKAKPDPTTACGVAGTPCGVSANGTTNDDVPERVCIANVDNFLDIFLFSVETQHTIGYGYRYMTTDCWPAYLVWMLQLIVGCFLQTLLVCVIVAKVIRPKKRKREIRFSEMAVIGQLDEGDRRPTLMIRLADTQQSLNLTETHIKLYMVTWRTNKHGTRELIGLRDLDVGYDHGWDRVLLLWPITIRHIIDEKSPMFGWTEKSMQLNEFELILTLEAGVEATGMTFQARTSYQSDEICWGYNFSPVVRMNEKTAKWEIQYSAFEKMELCGEMEMEPLKKKKIEEEHGPNRNFLLRKSGFI